MIGPSRAYKAGINFLLTRKTSCLATSGKTIAHIRVHVCLLFEASLSAKFLNETNFHKKNFALRLDLDLESGWLSGYLSSLPPLRAGVQLWPRPACGLSFSRSQPDSRVFLRVLRFSSLIKIDSQLINI